MVNSAPGRLVLIASIAATGPPLGAALATLTSKPGASNAD